jgi:type II pantothenate kinase
VTVVADAPLRPAAAIDFGASNTDIVVRDGGSTRHWTLSTDGQPDEARVRRVLETGGVSPRDVAWIAVTGGNRALLPPAIDGRVLHRVDEVRAIARGGLALADLESALVTSAGSGTACVAASGSRAHHVTGTGVGGGTLVGLGRLLLETVDPGEIDALAQRGTDTTHNLTIAEVLGGAIGSLPPETTAVNFGRVARHPVHASREDMAAALVNMVGQVIALIAINAARGEGLPHVVIVGHLTGLTSLRRTIGLVAQFYGATILMPDAGGSAIALGALLSTEQLLRTGA